MLARLVYLSVTGVFGLLRLLPELPDLDGFWGLRYCIEQRWPGEQQAPTGAHVCRNPQRMAFMLWDRFPNSADHRAKIEGLSARYPAS